MIIEDKADKAKKIGTALRHAFNLIEDGPAPAEQLTPLERQKRIAELIEERRKLLEKAAAEGRYPKPEQSLESLAASINQYPHGSPEWRDARIAQLLLKATVR